MENQDGKQYTQWSLIGIPRTSRTASENIGFHQDEPKMLQKILFSVSKFQKEKIFFDSPKEKNFSC
jgi:hypothetical protein